MIEFILQIALVSLSVCAFFGTLWTLGGVAVDGTSSKKIAQAVIACGILVLIGDAIWKAL